MKRLVLMLAAFGSACAHVATPTPEPILTPVEVAVPVVVGCVPANLATPPEYPDTDAALVNAPDAAARYLLLWAGRMVRTARLAEIEPIVAGCPKAPSR